MFLIPSVISTSNGTCKIITISYTFVLNFDAAGIAVSKDVPIPIVVGTIPFVQDNQTQMNHSSPLSYQSCVFSAVSNGLSSPSDESKETKGEIFKSDNQQPFQPTYPVYSYSTSNSW